MQTLNAAFLQALAAILPPTAMAQDDMTRTTYGRDWTRALDPAASLVCFPQDATQVAAILALCQIHRVSVVPSGGRTGLAGGAVAAHGEVVLSLDRMNAVQAVDRVGATLHVQAGAITEYVHAHAAAANLTWPIDFASKGSSQIGGNIATNAGGVKVVRYGLTRAWVLGLRVALCNGALLQLGGALEKNNTGPDLRQLFIGSEGIFGVITDATLKLVAPPKHLSVLLLAAPSLHAILEIFAHARHSSLILAACEFFTDVTLQRLLNHRKLAVPLQQRAPYYALLELENASTSDTEALFQTFFAAGHVRDGVIASTQAQARAIWALREGLSESLSATGMPHKNDIALPLQTLSQFCAELEALFARTYAGFEICLFGHIGDGNLHVNVMKPDALDRATFLRRTHDADHVMFELVRAHGGSISAEHGIGLLKKDFLAYSRSAADIETCKTLKRTLDPHNVLNPGKVFDL